jgi:hypothetical protein
MRTFPEPCIDPEPTASTVTLNICRRAVARRRASRLSVVNKSARSRARDTSRKVNSNQRIHTTLCLRHRYRTRELTGALEPFPALASIHVDGLFARLPHVFANLAPLASSSARSTIPSSALTSSPRPVLEPHFEVWSTPDLPLSPCWPPKAGQLGPSTFPPFFF